MSSPRQHTPGPWHSEGYPRYVGPTVVSPDGPVCAISTGPLDRTLPRMPAAANARLIAAAPTMFDYLTLLASRGNDEAHEIIKKITGP